MILAHAPIILPALLEREITWSYLPLWPLAFHSVGMLARVGGQLFHASLPEGVANTLVGLSWLPIVMGIVALGVLLAKRLRESARDDDAAEGAVITIG